MDRRRAIIAASSLLAGMAAGPLRQAWAATYPSRTIRLLVPFPPGGGTDLVARAIAEKISGRLGQRMIIENKSGGLGAIAQRELAAAPPDGHTLVMDSMAIVVFPHLMKKPLYDPVADLDAVALVNTFPFVIAVNPNVPVKSVRLALNIPTFINLVGYGYGNVWELAEVVSIRDPRIGWVAGS